MRLDVILTGKGLKFIDICAKDKATRFERMKHQPRWRRICQSLCYVSQFIENCDGQDINRLACHIEAKPDNIISVLLNLPMFILNLC